MSKLYGVVLCCFLGSILSAQDSSYYVTKLTQPIEFDGKVDESFWEDIEPFPLTMSTPIQGGAPTERSDIRIAYDEDYVYLSGKLFDSEPSKIMANTKKRDALTAATQWFGFVLDTYNDNENGLAFFTNPNGVRWDLAVFSDVVSRNPVNIDWNAFWDVKVNRNDQGWEAELRVPFSTLAFEDNEEVTMGMTTWRYIARKNEQDIHPLILPNYGDWSSFKPSLAYDITFKNIKSKKPFFITPYILGGRSMVNDLNEEETAYITDRNTITEAGLDIKYGLSKNWTLDLSVNTDFAQVEADDQQVNLTRFSLFFPEKRLFFQERAGIFDFGYGSGTRLFYSRRIGLNEDNELTRIYGGARVVGRSGQWDIGAISMQTADQEDFQGENLSVLRVRRQVINSNSDAGFMLTNRTDLEGNYNTNYGLDAIVKWSKQDYVDIKWAGTLSNDFDNNKLFSLDRSKFWLAFYTRRQKGFGYGTSFSRAGELFDPSMGFEARDNYTRFGNRVQYGWQPGEDSFIFQHGPIARGSAHWGNADGKIQSLGWNIGYQLSSKKSWGIEAGIRPNIENLTEPFEIADGVEIPIGDYSFMNYSFEGNTSSVKAFQLGYEARVGNFYDGNIYSATLSPTFNVSSSLEISGVYQINRINFPTRDQSANIQLARINALIMFDTKLSIASLLQYNNQSKNFSGNIRLRYNPAEGNDLFIVYNGDVNTDLLREAPTLPRTNVSSIQIKYSYTFRL